MRKVLIGSTLSAMAMAIDLEKCSRDNCSSQWRVCNTDKKCQPALQKCLKQCGQKLDCWVQCLPSQKSDAAISVAFCGQQACLSSDTVDMIKAYQCVGQTCKSQKADCDKVGQCKRVLATCATKCQTDQNCWAKCLLKNKQKQAMSFALCGQQTTCLNQAHSSNQKELQRIQKCLDKNCSFQWELCKKQKQCPLTLQSCQQKCVDNQVCYVKCLTAKQNNFAPVVALCAKSKRCVQTKGETQPMVKVATCTQQKCPDQWKDCAKNGKCISSLIDCGTKCSDDVMCWLKCLPSKKNSAAISTALCGYQCL